MSYLQNTVAACTLAFIIVYVFVIDAAGIPNPSSIIAAEEGAKLVEPFGNTAFESRKIEAVPLGPTNTKGDDELLSPVGHHDFSDSPIYSPEYHGFDSHSPLSVYLDGYYAHTNTFHPFGVDQEHQLPSALHGFDHNHHLNMADSWPQFHFADVSEFDSYFKDPHPVGGGLPTHHNSDIVQDFGLIDHDAPIQSQGRMKMGSKEENKPTYSENSVTSPNADHRNVSPKQGESRIQSDEPENHIPREDNTLNQSGGQKEIGSEEVNSPRPPGGQKVESALNPTGDDLNLKHPTSDLPNSPSHPNDKMDVGSSQAQKISSDDPNVLGSNKGIAQNQLKNQEPETMVTQSEEEQPGNKRPAPDTSGSTEFSPINKIGDIVYTRKNKRPKLSKEQPKNSDEEGDALGSAGVSQN